MTFRRPTRLTPSLVVLLIGFLSTASNLPASTESNGVQTIRFGGHAYVAIDELARVISGTVEYVSPKDKIIVKSSKYQDIVFTLLSPVYLIGGVQFRLPYPTRVEDGLLYASADLLRELRLESTTRPRPEASVEEPKVYSGPTSSDLQQKWAIRRIAIDPGHGGRDPGAVGPGKTYEKTITLSIAKRLGRRLEQDLGVEVVYTRTTDVFVRLGGRARIAREAEADLFICLHCNAGTRRAAGGMEVYFLSEAKTAAAAEVAERENAVLELEAEEPEEGEPNTLRGIALEILSAQFLKESQDLAASIRRKMTGRFRKLDDRGVKQANFYVMRGTMGVMPSVLVEMGFISNPAEEKLLKTARFQKDMAGAIFEGIKEFKQANERQLHDTNQR